jgi:hypothetical protein
VEEDWGRMSLRNAGAFLPDGMASRFKIRNLSRAILFQNCFIRPFRLLPLSSESSCEGARPTGYEPTCCVLWFQQLSQINMKAV